MKHTDNYLMEMSPNPDLFSIMHERRSMRKFLDKPIPSNIIEKILTAGFRAPFAAQLCSIVYTMDSKKIETLRQLGAYPTTKVLMLHSKLHWRF